MIDVRARETSPRAISITRAIQRPKAVADVIALVNSLSLVPPGPHFCGDEVVGELKLELQFRRSPGGEPVATAQGTPGGCSWLSSSVESVEQPLRARALLVIELIERLLEVDLYGSEGEE